MEKPDSDGYVNVTWPSKAIPFGGIFHTRVVEPSTNQQDFLKADVFEDVKCLFLKNCTTDISYGLRRTDSNRLLVKIVLLEESKLDIVQRRKSSLALRQHDQHQPPAVRAQAKVSRPRTSRRRSLSAIRESGIFEMDPYCPLKRGEDREKLKDRLAKFMECGDSPQQILSPPPPPTTKTKATKLPTSKEKWDDLVTQIRERAEWLAEMEFLGEADPHREIINDQIAERMRALDALGLDSQCSSARSGFSTTRSTVEMQKSDRNVDSRAKSVNSNHLTAPKRAVRDQKKEENVAAYSQMYTPLKYSPRRRV